MVTISTSAKIQTVITTFEVTPGTCDDLLEELRIACSDFVSKQKGFIGAAMHVNDARTRIANYTQWARRDDFLRMLRSDEMRAYSRRFSDLSRTFEPVLYEVVTTSD